MTEEERVARWGPVADRAPWGPIADPPPWGWGGWIRRRWPDWGPEVDPAPLRDKLVGLIKAEAVAVLQQARLEAHAAMLRAQVELLEKEMEILAKYGQMG